MATQKDLRKKSEDDVGKMMSGTWGLGKCADHRECYICGAYFGTPTLVLLRNLFISGMPPQYIPKAVEGLNSEMDLKVLYGHAWRNHWDKKRKSISNIVVNQDTMNILFMRRFFDSQSVVSGTSADKALENMMKLNGLGKETKEIRGSVSFSWEEKMTRDRNNPGVISLPDDDIPGGDEDVIEVESQDVSIN